MAAFATFNGTERFKKACFRHKEITVRNKFSAHKNSESSLSWWDLKSLSFTAMIHVLSLITVVSFNVKCKSTYLVEANDCRRTDEQGPRRGRGLGGGGGSGPPHFLKKKLRNTTGSPSSKYEHRRASALLRNIQNIRICMGKKTYHFRNLRKWKDFNKKTAYLT